MILRRIIQHVRQQAWTAIAIDFLIVVVGVYIGIQAQAWNTTRENHQIERQYLQSLHDQLLTMIADNRNRVESSQERLVLLSEVAASLTTNDGNPTLEMRHCDAIAGSHIYVGLISVPPTIAELISTGRLQLIRSSEMRLAIVSYSQAIEGYQQLNTDIQTDRVVLSRLYSSMITLDLQDDSMVECDFAAMRRSAAFLNDLADNSYRHSAYVGNIMVGQQELRQELHSKLDSELGISHSDDLSD